MIQKLTAADRQKVLDFCYLRERENLFVIGTFERFKDPFVENDFWGYFEGEELIGLATYFRIHRDLVVNSLDKIVVQKLVDQAVKEQGKIECIAAFKKYAETEIETLKTHGIFPKKANQETVFILDQSDFHDFSKGEEENGKKSDIDELACLNEDIKKEEITENDRKKITPETEFILRKDGHIVSKANIHGTSKSYFQIGGVNTRKEYRRKGYAAQVVSFLCKHYFDQGLKHGLLFTANDNFGAQELYKKIGFKPVDDFIIAEYNLEQ